MIKGEGVVFDPTLEFIIFPYPGALSPAIHQQERPRRRIVVHDIQRLLKSFHVNLEDLQQNGAQGQSVGGEVGSKLTRRQLARKIVEESVE